MSLNSQPPAVFTPDAVASINRAYEKALVAVKGLSGGQDLRVQLAEKMMAFARTGETDEDALCRRALNAVLGAQTGRLRETATQTREG